MSGVRLEDVFPLSPVQAGMLFALLEQPDTAVFWGQLSCGLRGPLDASGFAAAWQRAVDRHAVLRAGVAWEGQRQPQLVVCRGVRLPVEQLDWRDRSADAQAAALTQLIRSRRDARPDLRRPPLIDLALVQLGEQRWHMVWTYPQLLLDGWSVSLLLREVLEDGSGWGAVAPVVPFRRYIAAFAGPRAALDRDGAREFWRAELAGFRAAPLAVAPPERARADDSGAAVEEQLFSADETEQLRRAAARCGATLGTLLHGAWALLLMDYCGSSDVVFATVAADRPAELPGADAMVGHLLLTLPVRVRAGASDRVGTWLGALQQRLLAAREHGRVPLGELQSMTEVPRGQPLFDSLVSYENYPGGIWRSDATPSAIVPVDVEFIEDTGLPLTLLVVPIPALVLRLAYRPDRVERSTVSRMLEQLRALLLGLAADPERSLDELRCLPPAQLAPLWPITSDATEPDARLPTLVERLAQQAAIRGEQLAVIAPGEGAEPPTQLSYATLDRRVSSLAARLLAHGCRAGEPVGVALERSAELLVALLAIMRAGAVCVPLTPELPAERVERLLADVGVSRVLGRERAIAGVDCMAIDDLDASPSEPVAATPEPAGVAYLLHTSGSTGTPKAVAATHAGLSTVLESGAALLGLTAGERTLAVCAVSFDIGLFELFVPLWTGGTVVVASELGRRSGPWIAEALERWTIDLLQATPTALRLLLATAWRGRVGLRILSAGEELSAELAERLLANGARVWNGYGPTEATIYASLTRITAGERPTIGRPLPGSHGLILDARGRPVPVGVAGEYHVGGRIVALGYLGRASETASRFRPCPLGREPGARIYATGDRVRLRDDGRIEYLGRRDHQIKLRGHRIELGEIEATLAAHEGVALAAVSLDRRDPERPSLCAWVVPDANTAATVLRAAALAQRHVDLPWCELPGGDELVLPPELVADPRILAERVARELGPAKRGGATLEIGACPGLLAVVANAPEVRHFACATTDTRAAEHNAALMGATLVDVAACVLPSLDLLLVDAPDQLTQLLARPQLRAAVASVRRGLLRVDAAHEAATRELLAGVGLQLERRLGAGGCWWVIGSTRAEPRRTWSERMHAGLEDPGRRGWTSRASLRAGLLDHLARRLPPAAVPTRLELLPALPSTSSGKLDRQALAALERDATRGSIRAPTQVEHEQARALAGRIAALMAELLRVPAVALHESFFVLGGDSIQAMLLSARGRERGLRFSPQQVFRNPTPSELASVVEPLGAGVESGSESESEAEAEPAGEVALLPAQRWFFRQGFARPWHWNQAMHLRVPEPIEPARIEAALALLVRHHAGLRARFCQRGSEWVQVIDLPETAPTLAVVELDELDEDLRETTLDSILAEAHASLELGGPLVRALLVRGLEHERLILIAHHLLVDAVSWHVIVGDLARALEGVSPAAKTTGIGRWSAALERELHEAPDALGRAHWLAVARRMRALEQRSAPLDAPRSGRRDRRRVELRWPPGMDLATLAGRVGATAHELAVAVFVGAWTALTGDRAPVFMLESHGRDRGVGLDVSRTVGWFTSLYPVVFELGEPGDPRALLRSICASLRGVPRAGVGFELLARTDASVREALAGVGGPRVSLDDLGRVDEAVEAGPLRWRGDDPGPLRDGQQAFELDVELAQLGGALRVDLHADARCRVDLDALAEALATSLSSLVAACGETPMIAGVDDAIEDVYPLTAAQAGMLFRTLYAPDDPVYVNEFRWTTIGRLDAEAFRRAWQRAVDRHAALRSSIHHEGLDEPMQVVHREAQLPWRTHDLREHPDAAARLEQLSEANVRAGFDLARAPLIRIDLVRLPDVDGRPRHRVLWGLHHIVLDGWCVDRILAEVFEDYLSLAAGDTPPTRALPAPFSTYVRWLRARDVGAAEAAWRRALEGLRAPTPVPASPESPPSSTAHRPGVASPSARTSLSQATSAALRELLRRHGTTLNTLAQGLWALLLAHHGEQQDIVAATTSAGRPAELPGVEAMIGLFINTIAYRCWVEPRARLPGWLRALQDAQAELRRHEHCSLAQLQRWSGLPEREALARTLVLVQTMPRATRSLAGANLWIEAEDAYVRNEFALTLRVIPDAEHIHLDLLYDPSLLSRGRIDQLGAELLALFEAVAANADRRLAELDAIVSAAGQRARERAREAARASKQRSLLALLEDQT